MQQVRVGTVDAKIEEIGRRAIVQMPERTVREPPTPGARHQSVVGIGKIGVREHCIRRDDLSALDTHAAHSTSVELETHDWRFSPNRNA